MEWPLLAQSGRSLVPVVNCGLIWKNQKQVQQAFPRRARLRTWNTLVQESGSNIARRNLRSRWRPLVGVSRGFE